jgi:uncharacterized membrane protein
MDTTIFHPSLVHFPIALLAAGFAADLGGLFTKKELCLSRAGFFLIILGFLGVLAAFSTGFFLTGELEGDAGQARETHETFAIMTLCAVTITLAYRTWLLVKKREDSRLKFISLALTLITVGLVLTTGYLGGRIVWNFMIGI